MSEPEDFPLGHFEYLAKHLKSGIYDKETACSSTSFPLTYTLSNFLLQFGRTVFRRGMWKRGSRHGNGEGAQAGVGVAWL
jgi:hypothetical protein